MTYHVSDNKRIAKNTILLYGRMLLLLVVSLYTSRVVLATLGVDDYGLYNVVGGVVAMFTVFNAAMGNASHRFISFALGKDNFQELKDVVSATCQIHWIIAGIILVLAETVGLWFLHHKMVIPADRIVAVEWVYQFSIIACIISVTNVPYNAMIISHEKMGAFAAISIIDAVLKLIIVYLIQISPIDRLVFYAALILCVGFLDRVLYQWYCRQNFEEAKHIRFRKVPQLREMSSFAGWSLIGNLAYIGYTQGLNILLNMFFGPAVNAARGVAVQVQSAVIGFVGNFQTAVNPQIVKTYAQGEYGRLHSLIYSGSKLSYYLLYCMVLPICLEAKTILGLWLKDVPDYAVIFTILTLLILLVEPLTGPIDRANMATGNIKKYQIVEGGVLLMIVPISYILLKNGGQPYVVFIVQMIVMYLVQFLRLFLVCYKIKMSKREYINKVVFPIILVTVTSSLLPVCIFMILPDSIFSFIIVVFVSIICVLLTSFFLGLTNNEKVFVKGKINEFKKKLSAGDK